MSKEWMIKTLGSLGFTDNEANIFVHLKKGEPQSCREIALALKMKWHQVYYSLKKLQIKGVVDSSSDCPALFSAVPFDKVVDSLIKVNVEQAKYVMQNREELLSGWRSIIRKD